MTVRTERHKLGQDMRRWLRDRCDLATTYADDGAYVSALRVITSLQKDLQEHVDHLKASGDLR